MSQPKTKSNSNMKTISVALTLCLVCSVLVSAVAVGLKPAQIVNSNLDRNKNILVAADMFDPAKDTNDDVAERFKDFKVEIVDLKKAIILAMKNWLGLALLIVIPMRLTKRLKIKP